MRRPGFAAPAFAGRGLGAPPRVAGTTLWSPPSLIGGAAATLVLILVALGRGDGLWTLVGDVLLGLGVFLTVTLVANELIYGGKRPLVLVTG
jgi:hypothetical protein